jgi:UDP-GlcNAc:undecaprenyl-phosphate GlcNAc-1-phosphate transferase
VREYLLVMVVAAAVTYLLTGVVRRVSISAGAMAGIRDRDVHAIPIPRLGGVAMFGGMCAALLVASQLPLMRTVYERYQEPVALLSGAALIVLLGIADDKWDLDWLTKFAGQCLGAGVMVMQGIQMIWLPFPGANTVALGSTEGIVLSVFIVVVTMNAVNFIDGLDGLLAGVAAIAALAFFSYAYLLTVENGMPRFGAAPLFTAVLFGICVGFLPHNFHPARIFMGDSGSMLIGLLLAASTISLTGQVDAGALDSLNLSPALLPLVLPFVVIAVPVADLLLAVVRRTRAGRSPFSPDKQHLHHRLLEIGHSHRRAVLTMYFWAALVAFGAVAVSLGRFRGWLLALTGGLAVIGILLLRWPRLARWWRRTSATVAERKATDVAARARAAAERAARENATAAARSQALSDGASTALPPSGLGLTGNPASMSPNGQASALPGPPEPAPAETQPLNELRQGRRSD